MWTADGHRRVMRLATPIVGQPDQILLPLRRTLVLSTEPGSDLLRMVPDLRACRAYAFVILRRDGIAVYQEEGAGVGLQGEPEGEG